MTISSSSCTTPPKTPSSSFISLLTYSMAPGERTPRDVARALRSPCAVHRRVDRPVEGSWVRGEGGRARELRGMFAQALFREDVVSACDPPISAEKAAKATTEKARDDARAALDSYRRTVFPAYETAINLYLQHFNAGFRVGSVASTNTRSGSSCTYNVVINSEPVPVGGPEQAGNPSFRNTLSAGDRSTLALAFFSRRSIKIRISANGSLLWMIRLQASMNTDSWQRCKRCVGSPEERSKWLFYRTTSRSPVGFGKGQIATTAAHSK